MADLAELRDLSEISDEAELLAELRDVTVPVVSSWPAPGWWVLLLVFIVLIVYLLMRKRLMKQRAADAWRQEALMQLNRMNQDLKQASDSERLRVVRDSSVLLRKVMMYVNGRREVAGLTDQAWVDALHGHQDVEGLDPKLRALLTEVPYQSESTALTTEANVGELLAWLQRYVSSLPRVGLNDR